MDITKAQSAGYNITYIAMPGEHGPRVLLDLRNPFSTEATAAIKESFTADQWETIRAWGKTADAYLIAAVNQFAVEDPLIMYSLVSALGKVRVLDNNGTGANIDTGIVRTLDHVYRYYGHVSYPNVSSRQLNGAQGYVYFGVCSNGYQIAGGGSAVAISGAVAESRIDFDATFNCPANTVSATVNGATYSGSGVGYQDSPANAHIWLFSLNDNVLPSDERIGRFAIDVDGDQARDYIPCVYNGENGLLDLLNGVWYGNSNSSGSFTTELGNYVNGVWTPTPP